MNAVMILKSRDTIFYNDTELLSNINKIGDPLTYYWLLPILKIILFQ